MTVPDPNGVLPGTTIPTTTNGDTTNGDTITTNPVFTPGPPHATYPTTLGTYEPTHLSSNPALLTSIRTLINTSFSDGHARHKTISPKTLRLPGPNDFTTQLGSDPGTFALLLTNNSSPTNDLVAMVCAHRYVQPVLIASHSEGQKRSAFVRVEYPAGVDETDDVWELKFLATGVEAQGKGLGLGKWLCRQAETEIRRRFKAEAEKVDRFEDEEGLPGRKLVLVLTTVKESNFEYYQSLGYGFDGETGEVQELDGEVARFTVVHMSKILEG